MQRGRGGRNGFFGSSGDPFAGFPGFGGRPGSLMSRFFGGRDPFDDPFFTQPFGSMMGPSMFGPSIFGSGFGETSNAGFLEQQAPFFTQPFGSMMGPSMFGPSIFGSGFGETSNAGFLEQQAPQEPRPSKRKGPIITEISSDGEEEGTHEGAKKDNPRKHARSSKEPYVLDPDEGVEEKKCRTVHHRNETSKGGSMRPQAQTYNFHSSTVTYGGPNGAYYTASTTRRAAGDGFVMEESKEADTTTGKASHRVSRGILDKGHTVMRKLNSNGRVDCLQTLHNLNEDELNGFDEAWKGKVGKHLPGMLDDGNTSGGRNNGGHVQVERGWALPSSAAQQPNPSSSGGRRLQTQSRSNAYSGRSNE